METLFTLAGRVVPSSQRGRTLGFPTANLDVDPGAIEDGIYLAYLDFNGTHLPSLLFIGSAVTFGETERKVEVYSLNGEAPTYGDEAAVTAIRKLRDNLRFDSAAELIQQLQEDERMANEFFSGASGAASLT